MIAKIKEKIDQERKLSMSVKETENFIQQIMEADYSEKNFHESIKKHTTQD